MNIDEFVKKIKNLDKLDLSPAVNKACLVVEKEAKKLCPVDTGQLRDSIRSWKEDNQTGYVGTNVEYAPYVEYGTGLFAVEGNGRKDPWSYQTADGKWHFTKGQQPQPYLNPALTAHKSDIEKIFQECIQEELKDV